MFGESILIPTLDKFHKKQPQKEKWHEAWLSANTFNTCISCGIFDGMTNRFNV